MEGLEGIIVAGLAPHPPIIVPEVGQAQLKKVEATCNAMREWAGRIKELDPDVVFVMSPHAPASYEEIPVFTVERFYGDLFAFGASVSWEVQGDLELARAIVDRAEERGIPVRALVRSTARGSRGELDHGMMVPLYYLRKAGLEVPIVGSGMGILPLGELAEFGKVVAEAARKLKRRLAFVASGDLSHRLTPGAPAGYDPSGKEFDRFVVDSLAKGDLDSLLSTDLHLAERAGECGLRPIAAMCGALWDRPFSPRLMSYEGPFGVGYAVFLALPSGDGAGSATGASPAVRLARETLETYVRTGKVIEPPADLGEELRAPAGTFVSLKKRGMLRGCIGTIRPSMETAAKEIISNAIKAGTADPRFPPVSPEELDELEYSVDILKPPEPVSSLDQLDPKRYGVIVRKGGRTGLLLPDIEGVDTVAEQIEIACRKAGIIPGEKGIELYRFEVVRYH